MQDASGVQSSDLTRLSASAARAGIMAGHFSALDLAQACLARIGARDNTVRAWVSLNPKAEDQARAIRADDPRPLAGIPIAIKDMIETSELPTTHGSLLYATHRPSKDAPCVEILRAAGAIILGKTETLEFAACGRMAATSNPFDATKSPGGSSSGTAASVGDCHVPLGLGTQTGGSTIRPASYCNAVAFKPSWGLISTEGVKRYAVSFDTIGLFARAPEDIALLADVYALPPALGPARPRLRLGVTRTPYADRLLPEGHALMDSLGARLAGVADLVEITLPQGFEALDDLHRCIQHCEGASAFLHLARSYPALLHDDFQARVTLREGFTQRQHFEAYDTLARLRVQFEDLIEQMDLDGVLAPSSPGFAPPFRAPETPLFNAMWTALQVPIMGLPTRGTALPIAVSVIGKRAFDRHVIGVGTRLAPHL